jgi:hypothetical protein
MLFSKTEWHQVSSEFKYDCPDDAIIETFGSVERFKELLSQQEQEFNSKIEAHGEVASDEESDKLWDFIADLDYEREDDWWTDRKGGYDVTYSYEVPEVPKKDNE